MTSLAERNQIITLVQEAINSGKAMGWLICAMVQRRTPTQRHQLRNPGRAPCWPRQGIIGEACHRLRGGKEQMP